MLKRKNLFLLLITFVILLFLFGCSTQVSIEGETPGLDKEEVPAIKDLGLLEVHYIDVGQGDSILIKTPDGETILIDAGGNRAAPTVTGYLRDLGIKKIDHVIGTHPHEDHIGGLDVVIKDFNIGEVYLPKASHTSKSFEDLLIAIKDKGLKIREAKEGVSLELAKEVNAVFVAPNSSNYENLNDYSAVLKITYGETAFIFTGDAELKSEEEMLLKSRTPLTADVLKVGHHGSITSTGQPFLDGVSPKFAVISVGKDNDYGHPHREIIERLENNNIKIFRTDLEGTIIAISNGKEISFNKDPQRYKVNEEAVKEIKILSIDLQKELVVIQNTGSTPVDMGGWKLVSIKGNDEYIFPDNFTLKAGETVKIVSGPNASPGENTIVWTTKNIWNNSGDPGVLYDEKGQEVSSIP